MREGGGGESGSQLALSSRRLFRRGRKKKKNADWPKERVRARNEGKAAQRVSLMFGQTVLF